jgi:hypothetical protein
VEFTNWYNICQTLTCQNILQRWRQVSYKRGSLKELTFWVESHSGRVKRQKIGTGYPKKEELGQRGWNKGNLPSIFPTITILTMTLMESGPGHLIYPLPHHHSLA